MEFKPNNNYMKYLLALMIFCCTIESYCQIDKPIKKGNIVLGGSIGFSYSKMSRSYKGVNPLTNQYFYQNSGQQSVVISFGPSFGYFIIDGLVIGMTPSYSLSQSEYSNDSWNSNSITNSIGIGPFIKYYFKNGFFLGLDAGYSFSVSKLHGSDNLDKYQHLSINPSFGYAIFINSKVSIEPSLEYSFAKGIGKSDNVTESDDETHEIFFNVGFHIFL
jgi:hypothetical protein